MTTENAAGNPMSERAAKTSGLRPECATCGVGMLAAQGGGCCLDVYEALHGPTDVFYDPVDEWQEDLADD